MSTQQDRLDAKSRVKRRDISWSAQVKKAWGTEYTKADKAYEFSNGRTFDSSDRDETGVYKRS